MAGQDSDEGWSSVAANGGRMGRERDAPWALVVLGWNRPQPGGTGEVEVPSFSEVLSRSSEIRYVSPTLTSILGYSPDELAQRDLLELLHPDDLDVAATEFVRLLEEERIPRPMAIRARHHEGHWVDLEVLVTNMLDDPAVEGFVANVRDDTEHKRVEAELAEAEERFRMAFEQAPIGKSLSDLNGRILRVNRSLAQMFGRAPDEIEGLTVRDVTHPEDWPKTEEAMRQLVSGAIDDCEMEKRFLHADGHPIWAVLSVGLVRDPAGSPLYMIGQVQDVTEQKLLGEQLEHAAMHDELTGLPNRAYFTHQLQEDLNRTDKRADAGLVAVLFLDLDNFKLVSDSFGYAAGDELLLIFAERLKEAALSTDMVARFGGDEFTVLCRGVRDEAEAVEMAERIVDCLAQPAFLSTGEVFVTVSAGVAVQGRSPQDADTQIRDADAAMYRAKELGRARVQISDAHDRERAVEHLRTGTMLHHALERNEFRLHYQPLVSLESGRIVAVEGLLRWQHPERGLMPPSDFVGVAEETSLITPIGTWVFGEACRQLAEWHAHGRPEAEFAVSTNLSVRQLIDSALPAQVARILTEIGVDADSFWVEITEATVMQDVESAIGALHALRDIGLHLLIDDFGTGYSSMSYLKRLPVEALKIDQTFIAGLGSDPDDTAIVAACVGLARSLGFTSIAEGVETPAQLAALRVLGCEVAQGYVFAAPRSASELGDAPPYETDSWSTEWPLPEQLAG